jgi:hypothetical protein
MSDSSSIVRDEQFWFTGAVVAFNAVVLDKLSGGYAVFVSAAVSFIGMHIVLTRWSAGAGRRPLNEPNFKTAKASERLRYTWLEAKKAWASLPYIIAELSGSLFLLLLIVLTFVAVLLKFLYATKT